MANDILIVDDEADIRELVAGILDDEGFTTRTAGDSDSASAEIASRKPDLVFLDIWLQGSKLDGLQLLEEIKRDHASLPVVMISGHGNIETAVRATKLGAFDFIEKPLSIEKTVLTVRNALRQQRLELINADMAAALAREYTMVGESVAMRALRKQISIVAPTDGRVLIYG